jgi:phosphomannomutase
MLRGDELGVILGESIARKTSQGILANSIVLQFCEKLQIITT